MKKCRKVNVKYGSSAGMGMLNFNDLEIKTPENLTQDHPWK